MTQVGAGVLERVILERVITNAGFHMKHKVGQPAYMASNVQVNGGERLRAVMKMLRLFN